MSGRHEWLDPVSAARCCSYRFDRVLVRANEIPPDALPDGRVRVRDTDCVYVWRPRPAHLRSAAFEPGNSNTSMTLENKAMRA